VLETSALWLAPGLQHPVFSRYASFFGSLFRRFEALDYRHAYLQGGREGLDQEMAAARQRCEPRLILYSQFPSSYSYLSPRRLSELRTAARVVALGFDDEIYFEQAKHFYARCDAVITTDIEGAARLRGAGVAVFLAQLQQPDIVPASEPPAADIAVSFVGDMSKPGRREYVQALVGAGIPVHDYGAGSRGGRLSDAGVVDVFRRSRINLNFTRTNPPRWILRHNPERALAGQMKGRPFELAALGRFCLCEWAPCVENWFRPNKEIGIFRNADELVACTRRFLADDVLREGIARAARERYRAEYAPHAQFERIFSQILASEARTPHPALPPREPIFSESVGRSRAVAFLHALRVGRPLRALHETIPEDSPRGLDYWRGFAGGLKDSVLRQIHRP
jgi:hypothetical protein